MKKHLLPKVFLLIFFMAACMGNNKVSIAGKWKPVDVDAKYRESYGVKNSEVETLLNESSIEFTKEGNFISVLHDTVQGKYVYDEKANHLSIEPKEGKTTDFAVALSSNRLTLSNEFGKITFKRD